MPPKKYRKRRPVKKAPPRRRRLTAAKAGQALGYLGASAAASMYNQWGKRPAVSQQVDPESQQSTRTHYRGSPSRTVTQTQQDYRSKSSSYGYKASTKALTTKLLKQEIKYATYSIRNYGAWNRGFGAIQIIANQAGADNTRVDMPVHLWDLTAVPQGNNSTSLQYPAAFHQLSFTSQATTANHVWETRIGGSAASQVGNFVTRANMIDKPWSWFPTDGNTSLRPSLAASELNKIVAPGAKSVLQRVVVKMILNGPQTKPTKWCIQLVQLKQDVTPGVSNTISTANPNGINPTGILLADAFWQSIAKPYGFSPLDSNMPRRLRQYMKVLKTWTVVMDTPESGEDHLKARMHHLTLNLNLNRACNYLWGSDIDKLQINAADIPENGFQNNADNEYVCQVHPNARVWLMVRALCEFQGPNIGASEQLFPSYDVIMNATHRIMD